MSDCDDHNTSGSLPKDDHEGIPLRHYSACAELMLRVLRGISRDLIDGAVELIEKTLSSSPASLRIPISSRLSFLECSRMDDGASRCSTLNPVA